MAFGDNQEDGGGVSTSGQRSWGWWRGAQATVVALAVLIGLLALARTLPWGSYFPYFWDGAAVFEAAKVEGFPVGHGEGITSYALSKYAYSVPIWGIYRLTGYDATLIWGSFWFLVLLAVPALMGIFRLRGRFALFGYLTYLAGMVTLPYVHNYVGMTNPTIQSTALWLMLGLVYARQCARGARSYRSTLLPGILGSLLVLTDYKWAAVVAIAIVIVEIAAMIRGRGGLMPEIWRAEGKRCLARILLTVVWIPLLVGIVALLNPAYREALSHYLVGGNRLDVFRPALSWNLLIFLWYLGGFWAGVWLLWHYWETRRGSREVVDAGLPLWPLSVFAGVVIVVFSVLLWPRSARMFAPAIPVGLIFLGRSAQQVWDRSSVRRTWREVVTGIGLVAVLLGFLWRAPSAGAVFRKPGGVRDLAQLIDTHRDRIGSAPIGSYFSPLFALASGPGTRWFFPGDVGLSQQTDWVVTCDVLDLVGIREQQLMRGHDWRWALEQYTARGIMARAGVHVASVRNDFYCSSWYWCESSHSDGELTFLLARAAEEQQPTWDLRYVGSIFGRPLPDTTGLGR